MEVITTVFTLLGYFLLFLVLGVVVRVLSIVIKYYYRSWNIDPRIPVYKKISATRDLFLGDYAAFLKETQDEHGNPIPVKYSGALFSGSPSLIVSDPDIFREVLLDTNKFGKPPEFCNILDQIFGKTLVTMEGELWRKERKLLTPLFHFAALKHYNEFFDNIGARIVEHLATTASKPISSSYIREYTLRGIIKAAYGDNIDASKIIAAEDSISESISPIFTFLSIFGPLSPYIPSTIFKKVFGAQKVVEKEVRAMIVKQREVLAGKKTDEAKDLISLLLNSREEISDNFITAEGLIFLFAGTDTTSTLLQWVFYHLCKYPDIQSKIYNEIKQVFAENPNTFIGDLLSKFVYTKQVLSESLRITPPVVFVSRITTVDCTIGGYHIPKGCEVFLYIHNVHTSPKCWEKPLEFIPERFAEHNANITSRHPYSYIPFNAGERNCIGQKLAGEEALIYLVHIVNKFRLQSDDLDKVIPKTGATYHPTNFNLKFIPRD